ncbi:hypothetical protein SCHPADRAFT_944560 [Schizopora paradoxa]|uniref:Uncharacterized protein n=1 Tax=Schizopora paradoxa TaxID=27342 RepID=A0A0H2R8V6_9AGAM|nr:hypothetical protein SCHPADRAFT_944560 [Schizopora paradoxa]
MDAIRMPSLEEYIVSFDTMGETETECMEWSRITYLASRALLPVHFTQSTQLKSAWFRLLNDEWKLWETDNEFRTPLDARELRIPLERIFHIPSLSLTSCVPVLFIQGTDDKYMDSESYISEHPTSRLRELKFIECKNMTSAHLERTIRSLEALGVLDDIERVVIQDCKLLTRKDAMEVIGEERLEYLDVGRRVDLVGPQASRDYDVNSLY